MKPVAKMCRSGLRLISDGKTISRLLNSCPLIDDLPRLNLPANSQSINHRTSIRGKVIDSVKSRSSNARVQISVENNQMSFPVYAKGSSDHKITAQNIIRHGYPAVVKCERCHKSGLDCIVSKHHRSCAYCTSELNPWAEGCNALREVTKEVKPELQIR